MSDADADAQRAEMLAGWERAAAGWGRQAERVRDLGMAVSSWMVDRLELQPGERVLELAAGPGDTGFLAAELIRPGGTLICSDASEAMLEVARERARRLQVDNVEFMRLELEWIDLPTASVDAALCRWGVMLTLDPAAAMQEVRRVLRPGGRVAIAVWDEARFNPWATIEGKALVELGYSTPPDPRAPGMFALAPAERLRAVIEGAGFIDVEVDAVSIAREYENVERLLEEKLDLSLAFAQTFSSLEESERRIVRSRVGELAADFQGPDGTLRLPGRSLVASANS